MASRTRPFCKTNQGVYHVNDSMSLEHAQVAMKAKACVRRQNWDSFSLKGDAQTGLKGSPVAVHFGKLRLEKRGQRKLWVCSQ